MIRQRDVFLRVVLAMVAWESGFIAVLLWNLRSEEAFVPYLWPALFGAGAFGTLVLVFRPHHRWALVLSLVGLVCGHIGRSFAVLVNLSAGTVHVTDQRVWIGSSVYGITGVLIAFVWLRIVAPMVEARYARRR